MSAFNDQLFTTIPKNDIPYVCKIAPALVLFFLALPAIGFGGSVGAVEGRVFDQTEAVIPGVTVGLIPAGTADHFETVTEADGSYRFENVPAGAYKLSWLPQGENQWIRRISLKPDVVVGGGETVNVKEIRVALRTIN